MISFVSISSFRSRLQSLLKVKRGVYSGVKKEISSAFSDLSMEQIRNNRDMILVDDASVVIKLRLPDKKQHLSKSYGYRLIYMAIKTEDVVVFLDVYPKRGPSQQLDIEDSELMLLIKEFVTEFQNDELVSHDIDNDLAEK